MESLSFLQHRHRPWKALWSAVLLLVFAGIAFADEVDDFIDAQMKKERIPGLSLAVLKHGKILKSKGYGLADMASNKSASPDTVYQLASVTKCFTATAIMQLVGDGKLTLADKVTAKLPNLPKAWDGVTLRHLLTHTSGIPDYTWYDAVVGNPEKEIKREELIAVVSDPPLRFKPGERYEYSNTGYFLLGMVIEEASGQTYGAFLENRIFRPAGMSASRVNSATDSIPQRATGYTLKDGRVSPGIFVNPSQPFAAGALLTSAADLAKWDAALYGDKILKQSTLSQMWTAEKLANGTSSNYGLGWGIREWQGERYIQHNGGIIGFSSHMRRGLDDGLTFIVIANLSGRGVYAEEIAEGVARFYRGK